MIKLINKLKNRKGFTLIELIVVLAVLAIIMAIAVPRFLGVQEQSKVDADYATGSLIAKTAEIYFVQNPSETSIAKGSVDDKLGDDLPSVKFQSSKVKDQDLTDVALSYDTSTGIVTVKVDGIGTSPDTHIIYPRPAVESLRK